MAKLKLTGMTFSVKEFPQLINEQPEGKVEFVRNTQYDKPELGPSCRGIMVMQGEVRLGWVPNQSSAQAEINKVIDKAGSRLVGAIVECDYTSSKPWCEVEVSIGEDAEEEDGNFEFYKKDGKQYDRVSNVMESFDASGIKGVEGQLTRWMLDKFGSYAEYKSFMDDAAAKGTVGHKGIEIACNNGVIGAVTDNEITKAVTAIPKDEFDKVPQGFWNFVKNETEGMIAIGTEETVYDDSIMVAGTYDFLGEMKNNTGPRKKILIDWKTSKQVSLSHILKTCFYGHLKGADEVWVLALGSTNKCGYQLKKVVGKDVVEIGYRIVEHVARAKNFVAQLKEAMKK